MGSWDFAKLGECEHGIPSAVRNPDSEATSSLMALSTAPLPPEQSDPVGRADQASLKASDPFVLGIPTARTGGWAHAGAGGLTCVTSWFHTSA